MLSREKQSVHERRLAEEIDRRMQLHRSTLVDRLALFMDEGAGAREHKGMLDSERRALRLAKIQAGHFEQLLDDLAALFPEKELHLRVITILDDISWLFAVLGVFMPPTDTARQALFKERDTQFSSSGGKKSGEKRAKKAEETWQPHALELAKRSRQVDKGGSLAVVAVYIASNWAQKKIKHPGHVRLTQVISQWIRDGLLPAKTR